jgi:hypothetical protein
VNDEQFLSVNSMFQIFLSDTPNNCRHPDYGFNYGAKKLLSELLGGIHFEGELRGKIPFRWCGRRDAIGMEYLVAEGFLYQSDEKQTWTIHPFIAYIEDVLGTAIEEFSDIRLKPFRKLGFFKYENYETERYHRLGLPRRRSMQDTKILKESLSTWWPNYTAELIWLDDKYSEDEIREIEEEEKEDDDEDDDND